MVAIWEYSYNGLTFGGNQPIAVNKVEGLDPVDVREDTMPRVGDHGGFAHGQFLDMRRIVIEGDIADNTPATLDATLDSLRAAFVPQTAPLPFVYKQIAAQQRRINAIPTKTHWAVDRLYSIGYVTYTLELLADDPRIYDDTATTTTIVLTSGNATGVATNSGTFPTWPVCVFTGPGTTFTARNVTDTPDSDVVVNTSLTAGQTLTMDFLARTIVKSDGTNLYPNIGASAWWDLDPGATTVRGIIASGFTSASKLDVTFRSAWN